MAAISTGLRLKVYVASDGLLCFATREVPQSMTRLVSRGRHVVHRPGPALALVQRLQFNELHGWHDVSGAVQSHRNSLGMPAEHSTHHLLSDVFECDWSSVSCRRIPHVPSGDKPP